MLGASLAAILARVLPFLAPEVGDRAGATAARVGARPAPIGDETRIAANERSGSVGTEVDRQLEDAQAALLARYAPDTRVRRVRWAQGETQVLELGAGSPLLLVHGGGDGAFEWVPILAALARHRRVLAVDRPGHGLADPFD
jgi:pimeloyl-ACP methyl ester carboxylesterase